MAPITSKRQRVNFTIEAPEAESVFLVGDFNGWNEKKHPMKQNGNGTWRKTIMIGPGTYEYKFLVDGNWKNDPNNANASNNNFGTQNNWIRLG
jgi:5'-AMP-activated protein kinase regulatory beta subunit